jgi:hypothetical protein
MSSTVRIFLFLMLAWVSLSPAVSLAQNSTTPGAVTAPFPTLNAITLEWAITGDADFDGVVSVRYRRAGELAWREAMPLRRIPGGNNAGFGWLNRHSGSIFDLYPGLDYEVELSLSDPDGGQATRTINVTTRTLPAPAADAVVRPVTTATFSGALNNAMPGDILDLAPGTYPGFFFGADGTATRPIVIRGQPGVVIEGEIGLFNRNYVFLDRLTVSGRIRFNGSKHISITRCVVNASATAFNGDGIVGYLRPENSYIADNIVTGVTAWAESSLGVNGNNRGEGILVTGPGHVIVHNRVSGFRDNISLAEDGDAQGQFSIDIANNDLSEAGDDAVEADFCAHNCRILRNRVTNAFVAFSSQPGLGGPTYFVRNAAYNVVHVPFKLYRGSIGDVLLHNTVVKAGDAFGMYPGVSVGRLLTRNNLFIGGVPGSFNGFSNGTGAVMALADLNASGSSLNFDAFGSELGTFDGRFAAFTFSSIFGLRAGTSETDAIQVGRSVFDRAIAAPSAPLTRYSPQDLRPKNRSLLDAGQVIPNINDRFLGAAPDIGAYEAGTDPVIYGPRRIMVRSRPLPPRRVTPLPASKRGPLIQRGAKLRHEQR